MNALREDTLIHTHLHYGQKQIQETIHVLAFKNL